MSKHDWQMLLKEYDEEVARFSRVVLQPRDNAKHYDMSTPDSAIRNSLFKHKLQGMEPNEAAQMFYPYVDGLGYSIGEALQWMRRPRPVCAQVWWS